MRYRLAILIVGSCIQLAHAEPGMRSTTVEHSDERISEAKNSRINAAQWGLTEKDWLRYQALMAGRRGILSPGLDPLTALGVEAQDDQERKRIAEIQARFEKERIERELAYQRAYDEAIARLTEGEERVASFTLGTPGAVNSNSLGSLSGAAGGAIRYDVVVSIDGCPVCEAKVKELIQQGRAIDIWVNDSRNDDQRIRKWATQISIPADSVRRGLVTLNHGNAQVAGLPVPTVRVRTR